MNIRHWTKVDDITIRRGYAKGLPASYIAILLGTTKNMITGRAWRLGIKSKLYETQAQGWKTRRKQAA